MEKKTKILLIVIAVVVIGIALFMPYTKAEEQPIKLSSFECSDVSENQENDTKLNKLSCKQYQDLTSSEEESVILIARPTCGYCTKYIPVLEEIVESFGVVINYFNTDALSDEEISDFYESSELFQSNKFGTPTLLITKNSEIIEYNIGYMDKESTISWLKEGNIINEQE